MTTLAALSTDDFSNTTATTGMVQVGGQVTGTLEIPGDEDWFKVSLVAGTRYLFYLLGAGSGSGTLGAGPQSTELKPYHPLYAREG